MKKHMAMLLVFILLFSILPNIPATANVAENEITNKVNDKERVIILFKNKVDKQLVSNIKGQVNREYKNFPALAVTVPTNAIKGLQNNPNIEAVEKDAVVKVSAQSQDWGIQRVNAPRTWSGGMTGKGIKIAVIDTGIATHDDLAVAGGAAFTTYTTSYQDDNGHGTHVAGIIGAKNNTIGTVGIAPDASLYAVKTLDANGSGYVSNIIAGIDWSITNNMHIINLSLGLSSESIALKEAVNKAYNQGILVVAAAGNSGTTDGSGDTVNYPARYDSTIAVAATNTYDRRASFSSTGTDVDVAAPGERILSTFPGNQYSYMSGTSMAAPYVSGNLALLKQTYPALAASTLRARLEASVVDLGVVGKDAFFGHGLIQAPAPIVNTSPPPAAITSKTTVAPSRSIYYRGERVAITTKVVDANGVALPNANVALTITSPAGKATVIKTLTNANGMTTYYMSTTLFTAKGTYLVKAESAKLNYTNSSASTSFQIR